MVFHPSRRVGDLGEARGVALGEAVEAEAFELAEGALGELARVAALHHALDQLVAEIADAAAGLTAIFATRPSGLHANRASRVVSGTAKRPGCRIACAHSEASSGSALASIPTSALNHCRSEAIRLTTAIGASNRSRRSGPRRRIRLRASRRRSLALLASLASLEDFVGHVGRAGSVRARTASRLARHRRVSAATIPIDTEPGAARLRRPRPISPRAPSASSPRRPARAGRVWGRRRCARANPRCAGDPGRR